MDRTERPSIVFHAVEAVYSLVILAWFFLPMILQIDGLFSAPLLPFQLYGGEHARIVPLVICSIVVYLIPLICIFKLAGFFLEPMIPRFTHPARAVPIFLNILNSGFVVAIVIVHLIIFARSGSYFSASSPIIYAVFLLSVAYNAYFIYFLIASLNKRDAAYQEYLQYRRTSEDRPKGLFQAIFRQGIQKRLALSFIPLILVIIVVLSAVLMSDFSNTILKSVFDNGDQIADRTASVIKANPSDMIGADDYLSIVGKKNASSTFPFKAISYYQRDPKTEAFTILASTDRSLVGGSFHNKVDSFTDTVHGYNATLKSFEFLSPVTLSGKFLGYVKLDYARDVIYEPYFRTVVKTFTIAAVFIYASIFLIYVFGRNIVFPILFLRMSVAAIAGVLTGMIRGKTKISSELLTYKDRVSTQDEIKGLSSEIGNMTTVIRGIVPYISASTLKHSERETPTTERKDLAFLFTDIRGFTTLSEGLTSDKVVEMLNHYLDIQSSIIIANSGDVDKFVGDEVMASFDGPHKELNACKTGMEIRKAMAEEREQALQEKKRVISIGIGINTGSVNFGSVGAKDRMDFTSIGDTVNLAARLEGANKAYGTKTLITEAVHDKVKSAYLCREIDMLTVKGKSEPVRIFELLQHLKEAPERLAHMKKIFEEGLELYRKQKWAVAEKAFKALVDKYKDDASNMFLQRIAFFKKDPPPKNWDGVFNLTVK